MQTGNKIAAYILMLVGGANIFYGLYRLTLDREGTMVLFGVGFMAFAFGTIIWRMANRKQ